GSPALHICRFDETTPDIQLSLLAEDAPEPEFHGRLIQRDQIDFDLVKTWLNGCLSWHGAECEKPVTEDLSPPWNIPDIRVIDVERMCLVKMAKGCQYVTLSYIWGSIPTVIATKENITQMEKPGKLLELVSEVPKTIRDAIPLTAKIGQRFLRVDRLCIVQDDKAHLQAHIWNMERIYGDSLLLIIAADGDSAEFGLLGVRTGTPHHQQTVLPNRPKIVNNYTSRRLTWELDILDAFAGISNYWADRFGGTLKYGLPNAAFDWALLWEPQEHLSRRELGQSTFPSWSWAGWKGCVSIHPPTNDSSLAPRGIQEWLTHHTWIASLNALLWDVIRERKNQPWRKRAHIGYRCSNFVDPFGRSSHRFIFDGKSQEDMSWSLDRPDALEDPGFESSPQAVSGQLLLFWTVSARFSVGQLSEQERNRHRVGVFAVLDQRGVASGYVIPDHGLLAMLPVVQNNNEIELILLSDSSTIRMTDERYDKAVKYAEAQGEPPSESKTRAIIYRGPPFEYAETWNLYNVMLIEWRDRVAVRKGTGKIYMRAIQYALAPGPVWKSILLG
ncbi:MAG: hypothetical protein L6R36_006033, partial [Xanthoria steineri]